MFDCDKGYKLALGSPQGATCVDGQWSPQEIPPCLPEYHPSIRWLEKRSVKKALDNGESSERTKDDDNKGLLSVTTQRIPVLRRQKRSLESDNSRCPELDPLKIQFSLAKTSEGKEVNAYNEVGSTIQVQCKEGYGLPTERYSVKFRF